MRSVSRSSAASGRRLLVLLALFPMTAAAAPPRVDDVSPRGLQIGGATVVTIRGANLGPTARLLVDGVVRQKVRGAATGDSVQLEATLGKEGIPGIHALWIGTDEGIAGPVPIVVADSPQAPAGPQTTLPTALHGRIEGQGVFRTSFHGKKGQLAALEVDARRLGSMLDPFLELQNDRGVPIASALGAAVLGGDARLQAVLPADGIYSIELRDVEYRPRNPNFFCLKVASAPFTAVAYPLGGKRGTTVEVELATQADVKKVVYDLKKASGAWAPPPIGAGGMEPPYLMVDDLPEFLEPPLKTSPPTAPCVLNGRIAAVGEEDRWRVRLPPHKSWRIDLVAQRAGSSLDAVLTLADAKTGGVLFQNDDRTGTPGLDPLFEGPIPGDPELVDLIVTDLAGRGGRDYVYRIVVAPVNTVDFSLEVPDAVHETGAGGVALIRVLAQRRGFNGAVPLHLFGLPDGLSVGGDVIPAGASSALISVTAPSGRATAFGKLRVLADSQVGLHRAATRQASSPTETTPWLREETAFAVTSRAPLRLTWEGSSAWLPLGWTAPARLTLRRAPGQDGPVRITLVTSQIPPKTADGKPDLPKTIQLARATTAAAKAPYADVAVNVPSDLPLLPYDIAFRGELLSADGAQVLATVSTAARRVVPEAPFSLEVASKTLQIKAGRGPMEFLVGRVHRTRSFPHPIELALQGLPAGVASPRFSVAANVEQFRFPLALAYGAAPPGKLAGVSVVAMSVVGNGRSIQSTATPLDVTVTAGTPPPPAGPLFTIFDDEPSFTTLLYEGDGVATLEKGDRYSGAAALKVTGNQRYRSAMPEWGFRIAEKPKANEFRFLRFAWKKRGGKNILLQLNANGGFGPPRTAGAGKPAYRYEAGPDLNAFQAAALRITERLPEEWTVVTRDLFNDFGGFTLNGLAFTPGAGEYGLLDHCYLARDLSDFDHCPSPVRPQPPTLVFEDSADFLKALSKGDGKISLETTDKYSGAASIKVTPLQRYNEVIAGLGVRIREQPGVGEVRFLRYAWKKAGGDFIVLQLNHDGIWGPDSANPAKFRYHAGRGAGEPFGASLKVGSNLPREWTVVTRDLFADFGEFTLTGLALSPTDGQFALYDHIYLGRTTQDFQLAPPPAAIKPPQVKTRPDPRSNSSPARQPPMKKTPTNGTQR